MADLQEFAAEQRALEAEDATRRARSETSGLKRQLAGKDKELARLADRLSAVEQLRFEDHSAPSPWSPEVATGRKRAVPTLLLSDWHFDEVVDPAQVEGSNAYDRDIAEARLARCLERVVMVSRQYLSGLEYDGFNLLLGGDMFSGVIHEELRETNAAPMMASVFHWQQQLEAFVGGLAEEFGTVHVTGVVGNHGRNTRKPRHKNRVEDNFDWLLYSEIAHTFRDRDQVTFHVPASADTTVEVYNTKVLLTHGDQFHGGSGIAGIVHPLLLGEARKTRRQMLLGRSYDLMAIGHFHQYLSLRSLLVNGSGKGYDEFAYDLNLPPEPPQQAFLVVTPEHGVTFSAPIFVMDREREGW